MIVNHWKKYKIKPNKRNKSCKNIQSNNENYEICEKPIVHNENECFVCLEVYFDNLKTIKLNKMEEYIKDCSCDGWIHEKCFNKWHIVNKKCPICRTVIVFTKYEYFMLAIYNFKKKVRESMLITLTIIKYTFLCTLLLSFLYNVSLSSFKKTPMLSN
jgi:hypothetical protein